MVKSKVRKAQVFSRDSRIVMVRVLKKPSNSDRYKSFYLLDGPYWVGPWGILIPCSITSIPPSNGVDVLVYDKGVASTVAGPGKQITKPEYAKNRVTTRSGQLYYRR